MKNLLLIVPTMRADLLPVLLENLKSNLNQSKYTYDIVLCSYSKTLKPDVDIYFDDQMGGVWSANEAYKQINSKYDYVMIGSDKMKVDSNWYDIIDHIDKYYKNKEWKVMSWENLTCKMNHIPFGVMYMLSQETITTKMKNNLINPIYHHQCADPDLGMMMYFDCQPVEYFNQGHVSLMKYEDKITGTTTKDKWFKLDIMLFDAIWGTRMGGTPKSIVDSYQYSIYNNETLQVMKQDLLKKNLWKHNLLKLDKITMLSIGNFLTQINSVYQQEHMKLHQKINKYEQEMYQ